MSTSHDAKSSEAAEALIRAASAFAEHAADLVPDDFLALLGDAQSIIISIQVFPVPALMISVRLRSGRLARCDVPLRAHEAANLQ